MSASNTRSVERALALLNTVCEEPGISLSDAARRLDLAPSSAHRLLHTLTQTGHLARTADGLYEAGPEMLRLSGRVLAANSLRRVCRPVMTELAGATEESIYLSVRNGDRALYIGLVAGSQAVQHRSWEGQTIPLATSAAGRALTTDMGAGEFAVVSSGVETDVTAIAAPIKAGEETLAALSMVVPNYRLDGDTAQRFGVLIADRAADLSRRLGDAPPPHHRRRSIESARRLAGQDRAGAAAARSA